MSTQSTTRASGNATALPGASLTRRSALRGSAVAALAFATGSATMLPAAASPDASLIALAHRLEALIGAERQAWDRHSAAEDAAFTASPPKPTRREVKGAYADLDALSPVQRLAKLAADPTEFWAESDAADAEHKAAMAEHARAVAAIDKRHGVGRLERRASRASDEVKAASAKLAELQATTAAGVAAKARALLGISGDKLMQPAEWEQHAALLGSLLEDAARLGTGGQA